MKITIKRMETEQEFKEKAYVAWRAWHEAYPGIVSQDYLDSLTLSVFEQAAFAFPDGMLVAKDGDRVVGFIGCGVRKEEGSEIGEIFALYILPEVYGKDVGRQLMEAGLEQLKACTKIFLWVLKDNKRAIRFYQKCGFIPDGREMIHPRLSAPEISMVFRR